ncbi:MAG: sugar ABC transporter permease, partial [Ruminococcus sp.]|nr:sugar ABC transporter permease [Candidatus Apopatosoma intestinale]
MVNSKQQWKAWLYLSPAIVLLLVFTVWPIINTVRMSLLEGYSGLEAIRGTTFRFGLGNFTKVIQYK